MINLGMVKKYCCEDPSLIENYDLAVNDNTQTWCCHHRKEIDGDTMVFTKDLIARGEYYKVKASDLIFLTRQEHSMMHSSLMVKQNVCGTFCDSDFLKLRQTGENNTFYGHRHSDETKKKISETLSLRFKGIKRKKLKWITPSGEIMYMNKSSVTRYHPDWKIIE